MYIQKVKSKKNLDRIQICDTDFMYNIDRVGCRFFIYFRRHIHVQVGYYNLFSLLIFGIQEENIHVLS